MMLYLILVFVCLIIIMLFLKYISDVVADIRRDQLVQKNKEKGVRRVNL